MFNRKPKLQLRSKWDNEALKNWYSVWRRVPGFFPYWEYVGGSYDEEKARKLFACVQRFSVVDGAAVIEQV